MECIICLQDVNTEFIILKCECRLIYHQKCIDELFEKMDIRCPHCRKEFCKKEKITILNIDYNDYDSEDDSDYDPLEDDF